MDQIGGRLKLSRREAISHSAITVVSAFSTGKGVTIGTDLECRVVAELIPRENRDSAIHTVSEVPDPHKLVECCVRESLHHLGARIPKGETLCITIDSDIPPAVGLKSSSAVSVAVVEATVDLLFKGGNNRPKLKDILTISCLASIASRASLTGAFDDAAAGLLGGLVFSDNPKFKLLEHRELNRDLGSMIKILVPGEEKKTSSLSLSDYQKFSDQSTEAIEFARNGIIVQAMFLNSIIHSLIHKYSLEPIASSISEGASACGITGKGPAIAAICPNARTGLKVEKRWVEENPDRRVISASVTKPTNRD